MEESRDSRAQSVEENKENNHVGQNEKSSDSEKPVEKKESLTEHSRSSREGGGVNSPPHGVPSQQSPVPAAVPPVAVTGKASNFSISSILGGAGGGGGGSRSATESLSSGSRGKDSEDERERRDEARDGQDDPQPVTPRDAEKSSHASLMSEHMEKLGHAFTQVHPGSGGLHPSAALLGMRPEYLHYAAAAAVGLRGLAGIPGAVPPPPPSAHPLHPSAQQAALDAASKEDKLSPGKPIPWHPWFSHHPFLPMSYGGMYILYGF